MPSSHQSERALHHTIRHPTPDVPQTMQTTRTPHALTIRLPCPPVSSLYTAPNRYFHRAEAQILARVDYGLDGNVFGDEGVGGTLYVRIYAVRVWMDAPKERRGELFGEGNLVAAWEVRVEKRYWDLPFEVGWDAADEVVCRFGRERDVWAHRRGCIQKEGLEGAGKWRP